MTATSPDTEARPCLPPSGRSRKAIGLTVAAAEGRFALQVCADCRNVCYPAHEICPKCWSLALDWQDVAEGGHLLAETTLRSSTNTYFQQRLPWRIGTVALDVGPRVLAHIHGSVEPGSRVRMIARTDASGQGVLMALPEKELPDMTDDRQFKTLSCSPKDRRVLITDGSNTLGQQTARRLSDAGAETVFVGLSESSASKKISKELSSVAEVEIVPLDIAATNSVQELASKIGDEIDILINTASCVEPGSAIRSPDIDLARDEIETNYFGLLRLIQAFGPRMLSRAADGDSGACAWVNLLSVFALSNWAAYGTSSASQAAALSLSQCLRGELGDSGIKVVNVLFGPDDTKPDGLAAAVVNALVEGIENVYEGPVAQDFVQRYKENPFVLERELMQQHAGVR